MLREARYFALGKYVVAPTARRIRDIHLDFAALLFALALAAAACGGSSDEAATQPAAGETASEQTSEPPIRELRQLDNSFNPNRFAVRPGQEITVKITNGGQATHDMRIAGPDGQFETEDDAVVKPLSEGGMKPGDTASLQWIAPDQPGTIQFRCDFHPTEMTGTITVGS